MYLTDFAENRVGSQLSAQNQTTRHFRYTNFHDESAYQKMFSGRDKFGCSNGVGFQFLICFSLNYFFREQLFEDVEH